jgi:RNA recognition motif-containing protein
LKLYVGNLVYNITEAELSEMFTPYGKVLSAHIITDQHTRQSKNMGYVKMSGREHGKRAIAALNDKRINKKHLVVREA